MRVHEERLSEENPILANGYKRRNLEARAEWVQVDATTIDRAFYVSVYRCPSMSDNAPASCRNLLHTNL